MHGQLRSSGAGTLAPTLRIEPAAEHAPVQPRPAIRTSGQATLSFGGGSILLGPTELDRLIRSLRQLPSPAAASMAEEIAARRLTGQIRLCPTEAELDALISALVRLRGLARDLQALPRLLALAQEHQAHP